MHDEAGDFMNGLTRILEPGIYTRTMTYDEFVNNIGLEYDTIYLHNVKADCDQVYALLSPAVTSQGPTASIYTVLVPWQWSFISIRFTFRTISVTSSVTPGLVENSC